MINLQETIKRYIHYCRYQRNLNQKTLKAYSIDLKQFCTYAENQEIELNRSDISKFITTLHSQYKPKSVKRKIASLKALFTYLEYEELLDENPFSKLNIKFKEPQILPRTISIKNLEQIFHVAYTQLNSVSIASSKHRDSLRDVAVLELLFATGLRVSELCSLHYADLDLNQGYIRVYGKGSKERVVQITNIDLLKAINNYSSITHLQPYSDVYFFLNRLGMRLSEQSVRFMIKKYAKMAGISGHITPHMFRHTFATLLLEEDVDIRYIQQILGHSSILTTQIYTHVTSTKQRDILTTKHPRNKLSFE